MDGCPAKGISSAGVKYLALRSSASDFIRKAVSDWFISFAIANIFSESRESAPTTIEQGFPDRGTVVKASTNAKSHFFLLSSLAKLPWQISGFPQKRITYTEISGPDGLWKQVICNLQSMHVLYFLQLGSAQGLEFILASLITNIFLLPTNTLWTLLTVTLIVGARFTFMEPTSKCKVQ